MLENLSNTTRQISRIIQRNSPTILVGFSVAGLVTTVFMAVRVTPKALDLIEDLREKKMEELNEEPTTLDIFKVIWKPYLPATLMGVATITCIIGGHSIHLRRNAALMSVYSLADTTLKEYQRKVVETIGRTKEDRIQADLAQDQLNRHPVDQKTIIVTDKGKHLFFDSISGRYFHSDIEALRKVENEANHSLLRNQYLTLNELYFEMGLEGIMLGGDIGWEVNYMLEFRFDAKVTPEGEPCIVLTYITKPIVLK